MKKLIKICVDGKYLVKYFNELLGIGIADLLMKKNNNLLMYHTFTKNIKSIVILK